ncbi:[acyl-carrier-protein] S-malonyltransferase [candidate division WOR-1 bacterium RIFOXYB2_FULL_42_35]|uniref:Malonyl CoA-acyl carrier protein transacylase n=1 Tax=candidate division WOR-1 bacterium RIFOXYC2_FULL_41_25 TaxID=1802586 RepID=A0A1F4TRC1_UNCSA|nr:MAG: [acyl-carrier-protein] S-malonyltransferase [candidate division WOR-1 bacterium RIFOXYA2_FULL_41_14]OGC25801.1 MAG: [acyl-carrier-protein] S-malonyltransferase [candidate division WOR-1 bacterium RIFOXYB2_FULL_42_35]OGC35241.1 MAG: [acyl-carrier-protein] S-malonyltransferase [candidate division WOR-1 bacterium RIFOXYC2_FULL_41_25]OGC42757.1 MAG: [acyl-carrier-protein] S-malonyltransferase [candidate division WOR-1 bacterium RIFOXYD2_FULL_41_8]
MKTAFVFPGQGSQTVGMGKDLAESLLDQANQILGFDLKKLCFEGPEEELKKTEITQPAILTVSVAAFQQLATRNPQPATVAGHSLGEYSALVAAGAIKFGDAVKIVNLRGKFMQEAVPIGQGAMAAIIGGERAKIEEVCAGIEGVWPANFNSPGQIVISGQKEAVEKASAACKDAGAKRAIPLPVSAPFHCPLMQPAADKLKMELDKIEVKDATIPVIANVTAAAVTSAAEIRDLLVKQVTSPVLWEDSVKKMIADGVSSFVEVGPGKVLSGLIKKIDRNVETSNA